MNEKRRHLINIRLHELAEANGGTLTEDVVIEDAKDPSSVLHDSFEWDLEKAAYAHWVSVAARLINGYRVETVVEKRTMQTPVFIRDITSPKKFVRTDRVSENREIALASLKRERDRVMAALSRMRGIAAGFGMLDIVDSIDFAETAIDRVDLQ